MEIESVRARGQILPIVIAVVVTLFTLANAALNMLPVHRPTAEQLRQEERRVLVDERRQQIAALRASGDQCRPSTGHELARLLVMDGDWLDARLYADDYERRCGEDPVIRHWGDAPRPPRPRRAQ